MNLLILYRRKLTMGFYDQSDNVQVVKKSNPLSIFLSGLAGVLIGALLVYLVLGNVSSTKDNDNSTNKATNVTKTGAEKTVQLDIRSAVTDAAENVSDCVVGISNIQKTGSSNFYHNFNKQNEGEENSAEAGSGSGVIYKISDGKAYIVTNNHVVADADSLEVTLNNGDKAPAELVGADQLMDLAVITISSEGIEKHAEFGDSDSLKTGENVIAIGNPLGLRFSGSVTEGIVSGLNRTVPIYDNAGTTIWNADVLQTDAAINPGNSGGALVNMQSQVIGINSMKISQSAVEGIGLAIPINVVKPIIDDLEQYGKVKRPQIGISNLHAVAEYSSYDQEENLKLPDNTEGVVAEIVATGSPAELAGMKDFDVIVKISGEATPDIGTLRKVLYKNKVGDTVDVEIYRNGELKTLNVKLGEG